MVLQAQIRLVTVSPLVHASIHTGFCSVLFFHGGGAIKLRKEYSCHSSWQKPSEWGMTAGVALLLVLGGAECETFLPCPGADCIAFFALEE